MEAKISEHFSGREPSVIRLAQIEFARRSTPADAVNVAIGNVSLPMHPALIDRLGRLKSDGSPFGAGAVKYTPTVGVDETRAAFHNIIASSGCSTERLHVQITDGGSQAMELIILGVCGSAGSGERPLLIIDPTYTNYNSFAERLGRRTVSLQRHLQRDGTFSLPDLESIERIIEKEQPGGLLVIPFDNPTGQLYNRDLMVALAGLCVKHNLWMISDEAYRELNYTQNETVSIWNLSEQDVPGIEKRRISVESSSKVWNACGLRIGALVTDSEEFHRRAVAENTANLCPNAIGQYLFGALAHETHDDLRTWYRTQVQYYRDLMIRVSGELKERLPDVVVSVPEASIYSVIDVREVVEPDFSAVDFVLYCARSGAFEIDGSTYTLLTAPMVGFYGAEDNNPGRTQMRIAYVETVQRMYLVPRLFQNLLNRYIGSKG